MEEYTNADKAFYVFVSQVRWVDLTRAAAGRDGLYLSKRSFTARQQRLHQSSLAPESLRPAWWLFTEPR